MKNRRTIMGRIGRWFGGEPVNVYWELHRLMASNKKRLKARGIVLDKDIPCQRGPCAHCRALYREDCT